MGKASPGKESTKRGMGVLALALAVALGLFALIATSIAAAQSTENPDPLELYGENDNGVLDVDEAIAAAADGQVTGQSRPAACVEYDHNNNGVIDREEALAASDDYDAGVVDRDKANAVVQCYFSDLTTRTPTPVPPTPTPTPTPVPPTPTPTPGPLDPLDLYDENEDGIIDGEELLTSFLDYAAGRIDRDLGLRVFRLYKEGAGAGESG